jgi:hypothetical protein
VAGQPIRGGRTTIVGLKPPQTSQSQVAEANYGHWGWSSHPMAQTIKITIIHWPLGAVGPPQVNRGGPTPPMGCLATYLLLLF